MFVPVFLIVVLFVLGLVAYFKFTRGQCISNADLTGKTVIITGANTGIGFHTALDLARRNARVILACRNRDKAEQACDEIQRETGNKNIVVKLIDLCSLKSIRQFADDVIQTERRLDILINNAGVIGMPKFITEDGLESMFAANHFGPFLLTNLLLDLMKKTGKARIVIVSSLAQSYGKIDFGNLRAELNFEKYKFYQHSKLANVLFTMELARRLAGTGVTANCLHPGTVRTELLRNLPSIMHLPIKIIGLLFFKNAEEGAQTSIYCAISEELEGVSGKYFSDCANADRSLNPVAHDRDLTKKLWEISEKYTSL